MEIIIYTNKSNCVQNREIYKKYFDQTDEDVSMIEENKRNPCDTNNQTNEMSMEIVGNAGTVKRTGSK